MSSKRPTSWKKGTAIDSPVKQLLSIDPGDMPQRERYKFLIGTIVPRPIAFVSTISSAGIVNLAPFSFFNGASSNPLTVTISIARGSNLKTKDTLANIEETGEFVVNSSNQWLVDPLVHTAGAYPSSVNEMEEVGLTPIASTKIAPPRVQESAWQMECKLYKKVPLGPQDEPGSSMLIIGEVVMLHIDEQAYKDGRVDFDSIAPVARLGGFGYGEIGTQYDIPVPQISEED